MDSGHYIADVLSTLVIFRELQTLKVCTTSNSMLFLTIHDGSGKVIQEKLIFKPRVASSPMNLGPINNEKLSHRCKAEEHYAVAGRLHTTTAILARILVLCAMNDFNLVMHSLV